MDHADRRAIRIMLIGIVFICTAPFLLTLVGVDFGSRGPTLDWSAISQKTELARANELHSSLRGSLTHTILEWMAFTAAAFTAVLAFAHFKIRKDLVTPVIAMALFWAGCMDAFHTLAADRLIEARAPNDNLIPFTWAISRTHKSSRSCVRGRYCSASIT